MFLRKVKNLLKKKNLERQILNSLEEVYKDCLDNINKSGTVHIYAVTSEHGIDIVNENNEKESIIIRKRDGTFLTEKGAKEFIKTNSDLLKNPEISQAPGFTINKELKDIKDAIYILFESTK